MDRVLIAGGGIAGLAAARALQQSGIPFLVLERRPLPTEAGLAVNLPGNAITALAALGLAEAVQEVGSPVRRREYRTAGNRLLFAVDEVAFWGPAAAPRCLRRADLLRILRSDLPSEAIRMGAEVTAIHRDRDGVSVELSNGRIERGGFLVGADGVHSAIRRSVFDGRAPGAALLASASWRFMTTNPGVDCWTVWAGSGGLFLLIPVDRDEAYGWVSVNDRPATAAGLSALWPAFEGFPRIVRETLANVLARPDTAYSSPLEEVRFPSWQAGRVVLAGDAAHATAPVFAQGAALAMEDALVLAELLAERMDWDGVGAEYERRRRPRVAHVQAMTDRLSRTARMPDWAVRLLLPHLGPRSYRATYGPLRDPVSG